jgi:hypothetical protein
MEEEIGSSYIYLLGKAYLLGNVVRVLLITHFRAST